MIYATFGAGCFWGSELEFSNLKGVLSTSVGFMGGHVVFPTYSEVCSNNTGHIEVVQITYDESIIPYENLLDVFWSIHDPTTIYGQGKDIGPQYRSAIFYHSPNQYRAALKAKHKLEHLQIWADPIVTLIEPASEFYKAEEYHQQYLLKRGVKIAGF